jgi:hypothetical protein
MGPHRTSPPPPHGSLWLTLVVTGAACQPLTGTAPGVAEVSPRIICAAGSPALEVRGTGFALQVAGGGSTVEAPRVVLESAGLPTVEAIRVAWVGEGRLQVLIDAASLEGGVYDLRVDNPDGTSARLPAAVLVVSPPTPQRDEGLACTLPDSPDVAVHGHDFIVVDGNGPRVTWDGQAVNATASGCTALLPPFQGVQNCTTLALSSLGASLSSHALAITNLGVDACQAQTVLTALADSGPRVTAVAPSRICAADAMATVTLQGEHFLVYDGTPPSVRVSRDPQTVAMTAGQQPTGCVPAGANVQACTQLTATLPMWTASAPEVWQVQVVNPAPAACASAAGTLDVVVPPTVTAPSSAAPALLCTSGGPLQLLGAAFTSGAAVRVGQQSATAVQAAGCTPSGSCDSLLATFGPLGVPAGTVLGAVVSNGGSCTATVAGAVRAVDPPVLAEDSVGKGLAGLLDVTLGVTNLGGHTRPVSIVATNDMSGARTVICSAGSGQPCPAVDGNGALRFVTRGAAQGNGRSVVAVTWPSGCVSTVNTTLQD